MGLDASLIVNAIEAESHFGKQNLLASELPPYGQSRIRLPG